MGIGQITNITKFVPVGQIVKTAGTWTTGIASNVVSDARTAAAASFDLLIPVILPGGEAYRKGARLISITLYYQIGTAAATDFATVALHKMTLGATVTGAAVTNTLDAGNDTAAKRKTVAVHEMTVTLSTPEWIKEDEAYYLQCVVNAAATTVFTVFGAVLEYDQNL